MDIVPWPVLTPLEECAFPAADERGFISYRTNAIFLKLESVLHEGRLCASRVSSAALGHPYFSSAILKRIKLKRTGDSSGDIAICDVQQAIKELRLPFEFRRINFVLYQLVYAVEEGIFICLFSFIHPVTKKSDKHYVVIDCERKIILDSSESNPIVFVGLTPKQITTRISCRSLERVWQVKVSLKRRGETKYI